MDDLKFNKLVTDIQIKLAAVMETDIATVRNASPEQLLAAMNNCEPEFLELYENAESYSKTVISHFFKKRLVEPEDVWLDFFEKRFIIAIVTYDADLNVHFRSYMHRSLHYLCIDIWRKIKKRNDTELLGEDEILTALIDEVTIDEFNDKANDFDLVEDGLMYEMFFKKFCPFLNRLPGRPGKQIEQIRKILVFHYKYLLCDVLLYKTDAYILLNNWKDEHPADVSVYLEKTYSEELKTKIKLMADIQKRIKDICVAETIFLDDVKPKKIKEMLDGIREQLEAKCRKPIMNELKRLLRDQPVKKAKEDNVVKKTEEDNNVEK